MPHGNTTWILILYMLALSNKKKHTSITSLNNCFNFQFSLPAWVTERSSRIYVDTALTGNNVTSGYINHDAPSYPYSQIVFFAPPCIDIYSRRPMPHVTIRIAGEFGADRDKACTSEVLSRVFHSFSVPHVQPWLCVAQWHSQMARTRTHLFALRSGLP